MLRKLILPPGLFRLVLAYIVVLGHTTPIRLGVCAVYLFFMLSGYWVYKMWHSEYAQTSAPYRTFIISRLWRLLPVYYVALCLRFVVMRIFPNDHLDYSSNNPITMFHFYFSHLFILGYANLPEASKLIVPVWSLDMELQFYIVAPLLIYVIQKYPAKSWQRISVYAISAGFLIDLMFLSLTHLTYDVTLPMYIGFFLIGLHVARYNWVPNARVASLSLAASFAVVAAFLSLTQFRHMIVFHKVGGLAMFDTSVCVLIAILASPYAMATVSRLDASKPSIRRIDRDLSNMTYEVYVLHVVVSAVFSHYVGHLPKVKLLPYLVLEWILLLPTAWIVYRFIDTPIDIMRRTFVRSNRRSLQPGLQTVASP